MRVIIDSPLFTRVCGGVEQFTASLANGLAARGHCVAITTYSQVLYSSVFTLHKNVSVLCHACNGEHEKILEMKSSVVKFKPDVCISLSASSSHNVWPALLMGTGIPWILSEHAAPEHMLDSLWNAKDRSAVMHGADAIHLLLSSYIQSVPQYLQYRVFVIPNPCRILGKKAVTVDAINGRYKIITMARLHKHKQLHLLIEAFSFLADSFSDWDLEIWGNGVERRNLQRKIDSKKLSHRISLCGITNTPYEKYARAHVFCLPSKHEGFGIATVEAMSHALPAVGFAQCSGTNELIKHDENGLLVKKMSAIALADCLKHLMSDPQLRSRLGTKGAQDALQFEENCIFDKWEACLQKVISVAPSAILSPLSSEEYNRARLQMIIESNNVIKPDHTIPYSKLWKLVKPLRYFIPKVRKLQEKFHISLPL